jgi:hypothetical protein
MNNFMKNSLTIFSLILIVIITSCKKPAGEGGKSTIKGTVWVTNWNSNFSTVNDEYAGADEDVYIIYGDEATYGERLKAGPDGVFEFKYLRPGKYKVYVYSKDKDAYLGGNYNAPKTAVFAEGEIKKKKETIDLGMININN